MKRAAAGREVEALQALLERFNSHPRRSLLQGVLPAEMLKGRSRKALSGLSFEDIAKEGAFSLAARKGVQVVDLQALIEILQRLLEEQQESRNGVVSNEFENVDGGFAQIELSRALELLSSSGALDRIGKKVLKDYWQQDWPRAPFEEVLTFKQLAGLDLSSLLKKRAFTAEKMLAVSKVIDRAVGSAQQPNTALVASSEAQPLSYECARFKASNHHSFVAVCTRAAYEQAAHLAPNSGFGLILKGMIASSHVDEIIAALVSASMPSLAASALLEITPNELEELNRIGCAEVFQIAQNLAPNLLAQLEAALHAPAASEAILLGALSSKHISEVLQLAVMRVLLGSMQARHPLLFGEKLPGFWSKSERSAELLLRGVMSGLPKSEAELLEDLENLIEGVEPQVLINAILRGGARRDKKGSFVI